MFIGREKELSLLNEEFSANKKSAVLVYGKRRIGKSTLIKEAAKSFDGIVLNFLCMQTTIEGNLKLLTESICTALKLPEIHFSTFPDLFSFLSRQNQNILIILDEYQYLKNGGRKGEVDSFMQAVIDNLSENIKLVLCGSFVTVMKELLEKDNPLFGRFTAVIHLEEMDYYVSSLFYVQKDVNEKIARYSIFGGSPYVLANTSDKSVEYAIKNLLLPETGLLHIYVENIILKEIQKSYDVRIFQILGNGRKRYSEIENALNMKTSGLLDKQLQQLMKMESIRKNFPINKPNDKKKQFYEINDNLIRFYFTYVFGRESILSSIGEDEFYRLYIAPSINEFISRRFESIVCQYFGRMVRNGILKDIYAIGSYWYDNPSNHTNGEFDCVLKREETYDFVECKYSQNPMTLEQCQTEEKQINKITELNTGKIGFACSAGFSFHSDKYFLINGTDLYTQK